MSKIANDFQFAKSGRPEKYPWEEWSDGQTRVITRGVDFTCEVDSIQNNIHVWARRNSLKARTQKVESDRLAFKMLKPEA